VKGKIQKLICDNYLIEHGDKLLLALSGGIDSMALLHFLISNNYQISAAHCNFKLRGVESDEDERFVKQYAKKNGLELFTKSFDTKLYAEKNKVSIQIAARELRYEWFNELMKINGFNKLVVAHHLDDNIETLLINLLRGSGLAGIKGIPVKNENIIRPMLTVYRDEIVNYAKQSGVSYREDSSNKSKKYLRNKIRLELLDKLKSMSPNSNIALEKSMLNLADDYNIFNQLIDEKRDSFIKPEANHFVIYYSDIQQLNPLSSWLYRILTKYNFSRDVCDNIAESLKVNDSGKEFFSPNYRIVKDRDKLIITEIANPNLKKEYIISKSAENISLPLEMNFYRIDNHKKFEFENDKSIAYFDYDKLKFPLTLRKWNKGDRFKPFGLGGNKLVSDLLIDQKLSIPEKENIWLLCSSETIIWVVGIRSSDNFKVKSATKTIFKVNLTQKM